MEGEYKRLKIGLLLQIDETDRKSELFGPSSAERQHKNDCEQKF